MIPVMTSGRPGYDGDFGWHLGVLLSAYQSSVLTVLGDFPHGPRGYQTLAAVVHGDQPSQLALATHLGIDRTVMTYLIDDLVAAGLVERQLNPSDRRQRKIVATGAGAGLYAELERRVRAAEDSLLGSLEPGERQAIRHLLRRVACDLRHIEPRPDPCDAVGELASGAGGAVHRAG
jgi:MarR family transcriptional regulator, transcriptional regulator for hemolysin